MYSNAILIALILYMVVMVKDYLAQLLTNPRLKAI